MIPYPAPADFQVYQPKRTAASFSFAPVLPFVAILFAIAIFVIDAFVKFDIAIAVLYVTVVLISSTFFERRGIVAVAAGCAALTIGAFLIQHPGETLSDAAARCGVSLLAIVITTFLAARIQSTTAALKSQAQLLDLTHDAIFVRDMDDTISYWNRGAEKLFGWTEQEALGGTSRALLRTNLPIPLEDIMRELLQSGYWEGDLVETRRDGSKVTVASRWSLQRGENGKPASILETSTDIEERKRAQETLAKAQAELAHVSRVSTLGELTASIAHEVNQPLAAIVTSGEACLRWLGKATPQIDSLQRAIERMISDGRRASDVVRRLRTLSKKDGLRRSRIDVNEIVRDTVPLVQRELATHRIRLLLDLNDPLPAVFGDRVQLQQVIINLLMNAIQAMASVAGRHEIAIRSRLEDGQILLTVADTGPGFDPEREVELFNAFFTTKSDGMGMGLSICRSIIEAHDGRIWASNNAGAGATFQFVLPPHAEGAA